MAQNFQQILADSIPPFDRIAIDASAARSNHEASVDFGAVGLFPSCNISLIVCRPCPIAKERRAMGFIAVLHELDHTGEVHASADRRRSKRKTLSLSSKAISPRVGEVSVVVRDISSDGLLLEANPGTICAGDRILVDLSEKPPLDMNVTWASGRFFGCNFAEPASAAVISAALLKAEPRAQAPQAPSDGQHAGPTSRPESVFAPEQNFSVALILAITLWALIGLALVGILRLL